MPTNHADIQRLRPDIEIAVKSAIEGFLGVQVHQRVQQSHITYTPLEPEGHSFQISLRIEIHEKKKETTTD